MVTLNSNLMDSNPIISFITQAMPTFAATLE